jgi:hypothetical protein
MDGWMDGWIESKGLDFSNPFLEKAPVCFLTQKPRR